MKQMNHPAMNATITGYYPVGTEISPTGRYASSRIPYFYSYEETLLVLASVLLLLNERSYKRVRLLC